jgi:hypothetical protein
MKKYHNLRGPGNEMEFIGNFNDRKSIAKRIVKRIRTSRVRFHAFYGVDAMF